jgi:hypothetical protein
MRLLPHSWNFDTPPDPQCDYIFRPAILFEYHRYNNGFYAAVLSIQKFDGSHKKAAEHRERKSLSTTVISKHYRSTYPREGRSLEARFMEIIEQENLLPPYFNH